MTDPRSAQGWSRGGPALDRGEAGVRIGRGRLVALAVGLVIVMGAVGLAAAFLLRPGPSETCPGGPCAEPPPTQPLPGPGLSPLPVPQPQPGLPSGSALVTGTIYQSPSLGYSIEYDTRWEVLDQNRSSISLSNAFTDVICNVQGVPAADFTPAALLASEVERLRGRVPTLAVDGSPQREILGPSIGYLDGVGAVYAGTIVSPQGAQAPIAVFLMAATDGQVTAVVTVATTFPDGDEQKAALNACDTVLNTFRWPAFG